MESKHLGLNVIITICLFSSTIVRSEDNCVYTVYIRTGSIFKGGTDSIISLTIYDEFGYTAVMSDLESWGGLMESGHNYFERGNLDIFSGRGPCLASPACAIMLNSDGSGPYHGWYCNYVEVTSTGPHAGCVQQKFTVEQWLALDAAPFELSVVRDYCSSSVFASAGNSTSATDSASEDEKKDHLASS
ncbi:PLAT domain-containing protein [Drosera capensis]